MSEWNFIHKYVHTKHSVFTAPDAHITQLYIMSIQSVNKAVEQLINSYYQYWKRKAVNAYICILSLSVCLSVCLTERELELEL